MSNIQHFALLVKQPLNGKHTHLHDTKTMGFITQLIVVVAWKKCQHTTLFLISFFFLNTPVFFIEIDKSNIGLL